MEDDAGLKAGVEALRVAILDAGRAPADAAGPTLRHLALAALEQGRIAENAVAQWRISVAAFHAALGATVTWRGRRQKGTRRQRRPAAGLTDDGGAT